MMSKPRLPIVVLLLDVVGYAERPRGLATERADKVAVRHPPHPDRAVRRRRDHDARVLDQLQRGDALDVGGPDDANWS